MNAFEYLQFKNNGKKLQLLNVMRIFRYYLLNKKYQVYVKIILIFYNGRLIKTNSQRIFATNYSASGNQVRKPSN